MHPSEAFKEVSSGIGRSVTFKLMVIGILILLLLIPLSMVKSLIHEREYRRQEVVMDINQKWGNAQTVTGPMISIPYRAYVEDRSGKLTRVTRHLHFLPDTLDITSVITPEIRYRGIYKTVLYQTRLTIGGIFPRVPFEELRLAEEDVDWSGAMIALGISDMRGIRESIDMHFDEKVLSMAPGLGIAAGLESGVSTGLPLDRSRPCHSFHFNLVLNGSRQLHFVPVGKVTTVATHSPWTAPSFDGAFLPVERTVNAQGFDARWRVLDLNRNYPQCWKDSVPDFLTSGFGVRLFDSVDIYQKTMRTAKYALMFIVFAFVAFFLSEVINRQRVHPVQYLLIGLALIVFYSLLLSISEHLRFGTAYLIAAAAITGIIAGYAGAIVRNRYAAATVAGIMAVLYGYLYLLLQLEDYALLMGSIGLLVILAFTMYLTRKIDWYSMHQGRLAAHGLQPGS